MWEQVFTTVTFVHALSTVFSRSIIVPETQHSAPLVIECYFRPKVEGTRKKGIFDEKRHNTNFTADSTRHNGHPDTDVLTFCPLFNHFSFSPILPLHRTFAAPDSLFTYSSVLSKKMDRSLLFAGAKNTSRLLGLRVRSSAFDYAWFRSN